MILCSGETLIVLQLLLTIKPVTKHRNNVTTLETGTLLRGLSPERGHCQSADKKMVVNNKACKFQAAYIFSPKSSSKFLFEM